MNTPAPAPLGNVIAVDNAWVAKGTEEALETGAADRRSASSSVAAGRQ